MSNEPHEYEITDAKVFTEQGVVEMQFDEPITLHVSEGKTPDVVITLTDDDEDIQT